MSAFRWAKDQFYNPRLMTKFHTASLVVWVLFVPITLFTGLKDSIPWLAFLSVWALATGAWAALQAAHGEQEQDRLLSDIHDTLDALREEVSRLCTESHNTTGNIADEPTGESGSSGGEAWLTKSPSTRPSTQDSPSRSSSPDPCPGKNSRPSPSESVSETTVRPTSPGTVPMSRRPSS